MITMTERHCSEMNLDVNGCYTMKYPVWRRLIWIKCCYVVLHSPVECKQDCFCCLYSCNEWCSSYINCKDIPWGEGGGGEHHLLSEWFALYVHFLSFPFWLFLSDWGLSRLGAVEMLSSITFQAACPPAPPPPPPPSSLRFSLCLPLSS